jgi:hypothetical protein
MDKPIHSRGSALSPIRKTEIRHRKPCFPRKNETERVTTNRKHNKKGKHFLLSRKRKNIANVLHTHLGRKKDSRCSEEIFPASIQALDSL